MFRNFLQQNDAIAAGIQRVEHRVTQVEEVVEELEAMSIFIEEGWVQQQVHRAVTQWRSSKSMVDSSHPLNEIVKEVGSC